VLYLTNTATSIARNKKTKTLTTDHILAALEEIEFEHFIAPLKEDIESK
jgi:DNA polymerase epsilon subunit 3